MNNTKYDAELTDSDLTFYAGWTDKELATLAIPFRNMVLDALETREVRLEARAEERRSGTWAFPAHVREGLL